MAIGGSCRIASEACRLISSRSARKAGKGPFSVKNRKFAIINECMRNNLELSFEKFEIFLNLKRF